MSIQWPPRDLVDLRRQLSELENFVSSSSKGLSPEVTSWLCRFLVVRSCGYLEQVVLTVLQAYVDAKSGGYVRSFAQSSLRHIRNPSPTELSKLIARFDRTLCDEFEVFLEAQDQRLKRQLEFLVDRRNRIAHGESEGVNRDTAVRLKQAAEEVADWFMLKLNPARRG